MAPSVNVGHEVPQGTFVYVPFTPELEEHSACGIRTCTRPLLTLTMLTVLHLATKLSTDAWKGKKVVLFAVPGAFTVSPDPPPCRQFRN